VPAVSAGTRSAPNLLRRLLLRCCVAPVDRLLRRHRGRLSKRLARCGNRCCCAWRSDSAGDAAFASRHVDLWSVGAMQQSAALDAIAGSRPTRQRALAEIEQAADRCSLSVARESGCVVEPLVTSAAPRPVAAVSIDGAGRGFCFDLSGRLPATGSWRAEQAGERLNRGCRIASRCESDRAGPRRLRRRRPSETSPSSQSESSTSAWRDRCRCSNAAAWSRLRQVDRRAVAGWRCSGQARFAKRDRSSPGCRGAHQWSPSRS